MSNRVWAWTVSRLDTILRSIKPDTLALWEMFFHVFPSPFILPVVSPIPFSTYCATGIPGATNRLWTGFWHSLSSSTKTLLLQVRCPFSACQTVNDTLEVSKSLSLFGHLVDALGSRFKSRADRYIQLVFDNANTSYAEVIILHP